MVTVGGPSVHTFSIVCTLLDFRGLSFRFSFILVHDIPLPDLAIPFFFFFFFLQSLLTVLPGTSKSLISFEFLFSELLCLRLWTSYHHIMYALTTILLKRTRILYPRNPVGGTGHVFLFCCPFIPPFFFFSFRLSVLSCSGWGDGVWSLESIHSSCSSNGAMPCPFHVYERTNETAMR